MNKFQRVCVLLLFAAICLGAAIFGHLERIRLENAKPSELYAVINNQINALRISDISSAYLHVSSDFKRKCDIVKFLGMIREEYPPLVAVDHVEYGAVEFDGGRAVIEVYIIDRKNRVFPCIYTLVSEGSAWKIENVSVLRKRNGRLKLTGILS